MIKRLLAWLKHSRLDFNVAEMSRDRRTFMLIFQGPSKDDRMQWAEK